MAEQKDKNGESGDKADEVERPDPESEDERLDEALEETFPASDPISPP
ncbi:hypothetical protein [Stutzerimonas azotifigens]|nr:hypothetical protein [Stutzerimonas azotifigens]